MGICTLTARFLGTTQDTDIQSLTTLYYQTSRYYTDYSFPSLHFSNIKAAQLKTYNSRIKLIYYPASQDRAPLRYMQPAKTHPVAPTEGPKTEEA